MATVIDVKGYVCSAGRAAVNQKLSADRADNATDILLQKEQVPLPAGSPGAIGEASRVRTIKLPRHERRMNKAIAGTPPFVIIP